MFRPRSLLKIIGAVVAFLSALVTIFALWEPFTPHFNKLMAHEITINSVIFIIVMIVMISSPIFAFNAKLYFAKSKIQNMEIEIRNVMRALENSERLRMTDAVTGIPNQEQFFYDLLIVANKVTYQAPYQLIFLDLDAFGEINDKFGYPIGDKLIEYFAQSVYETMRRNETIYKLPYNEDINGSDLWRRAYRKYTGGDEFLFVIGGNETDALGFLVRLQNRILSEMNNHVRTKILKKSDWELSFSAAIIPIFPNDTKDGIFQRAHEGMRLARQPGSTRRVFWSSKVKPDEIKDDWRRKIYEEALRLFGE